MKSKIFYTMVFILSLTLNESLAKSVLKMQRSFGNFGPSVKNSFVTFRPDGSDLAQVHGDIVDAAIQTYAQNIGVSAESIRITNSHVSSHNGVTHAYVQQVLNGLEVVNGVGNLNIDKAGNILSMGSSFYTGVVPNMASLVQQPSHSSEEAVSSLVELLGEELAPSSDNAPVLKYIQDGSESLRLVWDIRAETEDNMYNAFVDTETNEVVQLVDWVSDASYNVYPLGINDPSSGERSIVVDPAHPVASPLGWHSQGGSDLSTKTIGNNVYAQENLDGGSDYLNNQRPEGTSQLRFDFPINLAQAPSTYLDAAVTNLFYWNNIVHDLYYVYGFNEQAGNFQENNFGLGGQGGDAVIANAQDGSGTNNANFATPPDGGKGRMRMYVWTRTNPRRDGDLDAGIIVHEYSHGLSIRLTGGPSNVNCLWDGESGGMGEGWGDIIATVLRTTVNTTRAQSYGMGDYSNGGTGIRKFVYSTSLTTNPSLYSYTRRSDYLGVHAKGEVWAVILYEVYWNLVEKNGFDPDWFNVDSSTGGNVIFLQLLIDGMKIQPCNPTFIDARNAILQADAVNNRGDNGCAIWSAFAKRGLGFSARAPGVDGFDVPAECS